MARCSLKTHSLWVLAWVMACRCSGHCSACLLTCCNHLLSLAALPVLLQMRTRRRLPSLRRSWQSCASSSSHSSQQQQRRQQPPQRVRTAQWQCRWSPAPARPRRARSAAGMLPRQVGEPGGGSRWELSLALHVFSLHVLTFTSMWSHAEAGVVLHAPLRPVRCHASNQPASGPRSGKYFPRRQGC